MALPKTQLSAPQAPSQEWEGAPWGGTPQAGGPIPLSPVAVVSAPPPPPPAKGIGVQAFFDVLALKLQNYEPRKEQYDLTVAIAGVLEHKVHLAAQAPTGTGKSFAVVGGIIAALLGTGKRAVIATANNSLLEQYASKDLPFLQGIFPQLRWARAKGKNNYACIDKAERIFGQALLPTQEPALLKLKAWFDTSVTGDREEIDFELPDADWAKINVDDGCTGKKCGFYKECHYYRAKEAMKEADVLVTNLDLLLLDRFNPEFQLLPPFDALVIDEAHQLEDKAISKLETSLTGNQVAHCINKAKKDYEVNDEELLARISQTTARLFSHYRALLPQGQEKQAITPTKSLNSDTYDFEQVMRKLGDAVSVYKIPDVKEEWYIHDGRLDVERWKEAVRHVEKQRKAKANLIEKIDQLGQAAKNAISDNSHWVSWVEEVANKTDIKVVTCPFKVEWKLHKDVFSNPELPVVCLSATLGIKGKRPQLTATAAGFKPVATFDQFRQRVGLVFCGEFDCPSPFNYSKNCVLYLPKPPEGVTSPSGHEFTAWQTQQILKLVEMSRGRALVLTTSNAALRSISGFLAHHTGIPVKAQGPEMSNSKLIEWMKKSGGILVGTASFWEGISINGDDLKLVIIDKLPFSPHTEPIQQAREAWYKANPVLKSKAFMDLQIYPATIKLMQGFGRLIRTKTDTGVVAILDPRLTHARYKDTVLNSLPKAYRTSLLHDSRLVEALR